MTSPQKNHLKQREKRRPLEFFQTVVIVSWAITALWISASYILAYLQRNANEAVTLALIGESFGVSLAYAIYQATLKTSLNKHGMAIGADKIPRKIRDIIADDTDDLGGV